MSSRARNLAERAQSVLGNKNLAMRWLSRPNSLCKGSSPMVAVDTAEGWQQVERQLAWFAGDRPAVRARRFGKADSPQDLIEDPMIQSVLSRAGSGPEELLQIGQ